MPSAPALPPRAERFAALREREPEVAILGGGITGAGLALDLALRGIRVLLAERGDWGSATSSASSRLIHGGLRYLQQLDLGLVRDSCRERAILLDAAAGLVWPEQFLFPLRRGRAPGPLALAAGLGLYTALSLPRALGLPRLAGAGEAARRLPGIERRGLRLSGHFLDAATHDARLVLAVVASAIEAGAVCVSRLEVTALESGASGARLRLRDRSGAAGGEGEIELGCRAAVIAAGPSTDLVRARFGLGGVWIAPTRGSHIALARERLPTDGAVIFASPVDGRVMFLIPWPRHTIVGTTDLDADAREEVRATRAEVRYLLDSANGLCPEARLTEADVAATWAGLRPLLASNETNPSARSREERVEREGAVWTVAGGKLTGYRSMAERLGARLARELGIGSAARRSPTRTHRLRGAFAERVGRSDWSALAGGRAPEFSVENALEHRYAALAPEVRALCARLPGGEERLDPETLAGEVDWCVAREDCLEPSDFLLRRTNLGLAPPERSGPAGERVLARMAAALSWSPERRLRSAEAMRADLARVHRWRTDPA